MADDVPSAIPWYKSHVLRSLLVILVSQGIARLQTRFHIDMNMYGVSTADAVNWLMDIISAGAIAWAAKARVSMPQPTITSTQAKADVQNVTTNQDCPNKESP